MDRNFILAIVLSMAVLFAWDFFVAGPQRKALEAARQQAAQEQAETAQAQKQDIPGIVGVQPPVDKTLSIEEALAHAPGRVSIRTPDLEGSINLQGGRIDDLKLLHYHETVDDKSPTIRLLSPNEAEHGHYIQLGWFVGQKTSQNALWSAPAGAALTPTTPITLTRTQDGLVFEKTIAVDKRYMFTVTQTVRNESGEAKTLTPYAAVKQHNVPAEKNRGSYLLQEGPLGVIGKQLYERKYKRLIKKADAGVNASGVGGWVGITNKNWLAAAAPPQDEEMKALLDNIGTAEAPLFIASYSLPQRTLAPGESATLTTHVFGGPKDVDLLQSYEHAPEKGGLGIYDFDKSVSWGPLFILTRPIFYTLNFFGDLTGNFGVAILILTLIIKALLFPIANKGFESMAKMKKLQPEIEKLRTRYADDKLKQQQEMMALYQKEKMNPLAGCLPILFQMPVFYALYSTLFVTIEMRHQPFLYIKDLSAPDPTTIFNLFGLLPFDPTSLPVIGAFLGIGFLPLLMGVAMWFQTKLNPPPADPTQRQIFAMMPFIFVFLFASFASGLVLYWFWNTALSILQQWLIMKRNGQSIDWGERFSLPWGKKKPEPGK